MNAFIYQDTATQNLVAIQLLAHDAARQQDWPAAVRHYCAWLALEPESEFAHAGLAQTTAALLDSRGDVLGVPIVQTALIAALPVEELAPFATQMPLPEPKPEVVIANEALVRRLRMYAYVRRAVERLIGHH